MLTRYLHNDPFTDLFRLHDQLARTTRSFTGQAPEAPRAWVPAVDVYERDEQLVFEAELPGLKPEEVEIEVEKGVLTLRGERNAERKSDDEGTFRLERSWGRFERSFRLTDAVDPDTAKADMEHGVLTVSFDKRAAERPRKVTINGAAKPELKDAAA